MIIIKILVVKLLWNVSGTHNVEQDENAIDQKTQEAGNDTKTQEHDGCN